MNTEYTDKPKHVITRRRRIFSKTFGIPGFIFSLLSGWFAVLQSFMAITAIGTTELANENLLMITFAEIMNIPVLTLCFCALFWAFLSIAACALSRFLGTFTKINQAGLVISVVSVICSTSLGFFSVIYMLMA